MCLFHNKTSEQLSLKRHFRLFQLSIVCEQRCIPSFCIAGHRTTCTVVRTSSANYTQLTCYYPEDVGLLKRNIQVNRLSGGNGESEKRSPFFFPTPSVFSHILSGCCLLTLKSIIVIIFFIIPQVLLVLVSKTALLLQHFHFHTIFSFHFYSLCFCVACEGLLYLPNIVYCLYTNLFLEGLCPQVQIWWIANGPVENHSVL